jgi:hypothetical protein
VLLPSKQRVVAGWLPLAVGLSDTFLFGCSRLSEQVSASIGAYRDVLLSGGLDLGTSSAGCFHNPPSFILVRSEKCREIHVSIRSFNRSPDHYPGIRRIHLSVAELPAAVRSLINPGCFPFNRCWQRRGPNSGQWP